MREQTVCVKLKMPWMGYPKDAIVKLGDRMAQTLFRRDAGEIYHSEKPAEVKKKLQRREHDKMVRSSQNK